jgi:hypothetical protein
MRKSLFRLGTTWLVSLAILALPLGSAAQQNTNKPAEKKSGTQGADTEKTPKAGPFHGKLVALDRAAKTITVGKRTFHITSETKLKKAGKPATLDAGVVGEVVSGYVKPSPDGKLVATTVTFGPKPAGEPGEKQKAAEKENAAK